MSIQSPLNKYLGLVLSPKKKEMKNNRSSSINDKEIENKKEQLQQV